MAPGHVETKHVEDDVWLVTAEGEHDLSVSPSVGDALDDLERRIGTRIVVDLTPAEFIDSTVIQSLFRHADRHDRLLVVVPSDSFARRLVQLLRLDDHVEVYASVDAALVALAKPA
jgi:anti-anti-sigma factor